MQVDWIADNEVRLQADSIDRHEVDEGASQPDPSVLPHGGAAAGALRRGRMPSPGGDTIGRRRLDAHLDAFRDLGAMVGGEIWIELSAPAEGLRATRIFMDEPSVMGTENALLAAALTEGPTTIANAASEPHVQDLARLLTQDGGAGGRDRLQRDDRARPRQARWRRARHLPRPHRDRQLHGAGRRHRRRAANPRHRPRGPRGNPPSLPAPRPANDGRRTPTCWSRRSRS